MIERENGEIGKEIINQGYYYNEKPNDFDFNQNKSKQTISENKNIYLTNFFSKLQNAYTSSNNIQVINLPQQSQGTSPMKSPFINISIDNSNKFNFWNPEDEKKLLTTETNLNDSDLLNSEMKSLRTPKELEGNTKKIIYDDRMLFNDDELADINKSIDYNNLFEPKNLDQNKKSEIKIKDKQLENKEEKIKKLDPKVLLVKKHKTNSGQIKNCIMKTSLLRNSRNINSNNNSMVNINTNSVVIKPKIMIEKKMNISTNKSNMGSRTSTPNGNIAKIIFDDMTNKNNSTIDKNTVHGSNSKNNLGQKKLSNSSIKQLAYKSKKCISKIAAANNINLGNSSILTDLEGIFGENLENFEEDCNNIYEIFSII